MKEQPSDTAKGKKETDKLIAVAHQIQRNIFVAKIRIINQPVQQPPDKEDQ